MHVSANIARAHAALCTATIAFAVAFALPLALPIPLLWYHPIEGTWSLGVAPTGLAMDWYGRLLWALLAALVGYGLGRLVPLRLGASPRAMRLWAIATALVVLTAMALFVFVLAERAPVPLAGADVSVHTR